MKPNKRIADAVPVIKAILAATGTTRPLALLTLISLCRAKENRDDSGMPLLSRETTTLTLREDIKPHALCNESLHHVILQALERSNSAIPECYNGDFLYILKQSKLTFCREHDRGCADAATQQYFSYAEEVLSNQLYTNTERPKGWDTLCKLLGQLSMENAYGGIARMVQDIGSAHVPMVVLSMGLICALEKEQNWKRERAMNVFTSFMGNEPLPAVSEAITLAQGCWLSPEILREDAGRINAAIREATITADPIALTVLAYLCRAAAVEPEHPVPPLPKETPTWFLELKQALLTATPLKNGGGMPNF